MKSPPFLWQGLVQARAQYFLKMLIVKGMSNHCLSVNTVAGRIMSLISRVTIAWTLVSFALHPRELVKFIDILHRLTHGGVTFERVIPAGARFLKVPITFLARRVVLCLPCFYSRSKSQ